MRKKLLTLLAICLLPIALLAGSGDVNGDGKINVADIVELVNYLRGNPSGKFIYAEADVNNDGTVNEADIKTLANKALFGEVEADNIYFGCKDVALVVVAPPSGGIIEIPIIGSTTFDVKVNCISNMRQLPDIIKDGVRYVRLEVDAVEEDIIDRWVSYYAEKVAGWGNGFSYSQPNKYAPPLEELKEALVELYQATGGENWTNNDNWLSDKPIGQWYGINNCRFNSGDLTIGEYVRFVDLMNNNLVGEIPESFSKLMDLPEGGEIYKNFKIDLNDNSIYGKIPDLVIKHPRWKALGWNIVRQYPYVSFFKCDDWGLQMDDYEIDHVNGNLTSSKDLFAKYKLTTVMTNMPSAEMINVHMSYHNKGYGTIYSPYDFFGGTRDRLAEDIQKAPIDMEGVWDAKWAAENDSQLGGLRMRGTWYVIDGEGNLVACLMRDWDIPESWYASKVDSICRSRLGEPEEHDIFSYYTSTDYSKDGEVFVLQRATVGRGIDIIFMGDAYVDRDMDKGGKYETDMRQGMENFFAVEPYKSLRERFNVYAVKVVSPNDFIGGEGCEQKINYDDAICFQYAQGVDGIDMDNVTIVNIVNNQGAIMNGHANMYETGSSVAHIESGGPSEIIVHEAGGHGFAKLLDEYIYGGYEENHTQEGENEGFRNWIKTEYHDKGWGMNISATEDPEDVPWAHFLKDDRYKDEIGIYKGAWMWPEELWRPSENSVMNNDYSWFNAPSREAIYKRIMKLSEGDEWEYDYETFVTFDEPIREAYKAAQSRSRTRGGEVQKRRIESRPPTIYKGTWRDAGKCEKVEYISR